jgi:hypothetical protein
MSVYTFSVFIGIKEWFKPYKFDYHAALDIHVVGVGIIVLGVGVSFTKEIG